jgi:hypothetical protein
VTALPEELDGDGLEPSVALELSAARTPGERERSSAIQILSRLASCVVLFRSADGHFCAQVPVGARLEIFGLRSGGFRDWLVDCFHHPTLALRLSFLWLCGFA